MPKCAETKKNTKKMLKGMFQEQTVELIWAQEPSITLQFWFRTALSPST